MAILRYSQVLELEKYYNRHQWRTTEAETRHEHEHDSKLSQHLDVGCWILLDPASGRNHSTPPTSPLGGSILRQAERDRLRNRDLIPSSDPHTHTCLRLQRHPCHSSIIHRIIVSLIPHERPNTRHGHTPLPLHFNVPIESLDARIGLVRDGPY